MNNLTGRSRHSPRHCPISADAPESQLVRNGKYEAVDHKSSRLVSQEVSDLWRATTPDAVNISDNFSQREFTAALQHLKPGKAPGPDSIYSELIPYAGAALKSWTRDFLSSCLRRLKIPKIWRRALVVAIPKPTKPVGDPKSYRPISLLCVSYQILRLRTGVGRFHSSMHKWGLAPSPNCECGASEQTADHVLTACSIHRVPHGARGLTDLDDETRYWLNDITAGI